MEENHTGMEPESLRKTGLSRRGQTQFWRPWASEAKSVSQTNGIVHNPAIINQVKRKAAGEYLEHELSSKPGNENEVEKATRTYAKQSFPCSLCVSSFTAKQSLQRHEKTVHDTYREFQCRFCARTFLSKLGVEGHLRRQHSFFGRKKPEDYTCSVCGKIVAGSKRALKDHMMRKHSKQKPFSCRVCFQQFAEMSELQRHAKFFHDRSYKCNICAMTFSTMSEMAEHKSTQHPLFVANTPEDPTCPICNKRFFGSFYNFKVHLRVHTGEKPFSCPECPYKSAISGNLKVHINSVHKRNKSLKQTL